MLLKPSSTSANRPPKPPRGVFYPVFDSLRCLLYQFFVEGVKYPTSYSSGGYLYFFHILLVDCVVSYLLEFWFNIGLQSITSSPSRVTISRRTPCIDGC